jgi:Flp pilus assembly protein TadD
MRAVLATVLVSVFLGAAVFAQNVPPEALFQEAVEAQQQRDFPKAIAAYELFLKTHPDSPEALANLGAALAEVGRFDDAIARYRAALKLMPGNLQIQGNLALALYKKGDVAAAATEFAALLHSDPSNLRVAILLGDSYSRLNRPAEAVSLLQPFEKQHSDDLDLAYAFGSALIGDGKAREGLPLVERAATGKQSAEAYFLAGSTWLKLNEYPAARQNLEKCVRLDPRYPQGYTLLGILLEQANDAASAEADLRKALALKQDDFMANLHLGGVLYSKRDLTAAEPYIDRACSLDPNSMFAKYERALIEKASENFDAALTDLEQIVQRDPNWLQPHVELAALYYKLHRQTDGLKERQIVDRLTAEERAKGPEPPNNRGNLPAH